LVRKLQIQVSLEVTLANQEWVEWSLQLSPSLPDKSCTLTLASNLLLTVMLPVDGMEVVWAAAMAAVAAVRPMCKSSTRRPQLGLPKS